MERRAFPCSLWGKLSWEVGIRLFKIQQDQQISCKHPQDKCFRFCETPTVSVVQAFLCYWFVFLQSLKNVKKEKKEVFFVVSAVAFCLWALPKQATCLHQGLYFLHWLLATPPTPTPPHRPFGIGKALHLHHSIGLRKERKTGCQGGGAPSFCFLNHQVPFLLLFLSQTEEFLSDFCWRYHVRLICLNSFWLTCYTKWN